MIATTANSAGRPNPRRSFTLYADIAENLIQRMQIRPGHVTATIRQRPVALMLLHFKETEDARRDARSGG
mgnify:CR=1 FL=1